jgi:hypothetical protein
MKTAKINHHLVKMPPGSNSCCFHSDWDEREAAFRPDNLKILLLAKFRQSRYL